MLVLRFFLSTVIQTVALIQDKRSRQKQAKRLISIAGSGATLFQQCIARASFALEMAAVTFCGVCANAGRSNMDVEIVWIQMVTVTSKDL